MRVCSAEYECGLVVMCVVRCGGVIWCKTCFLFLDHVTKKNIFLGTGGQSVSPLKQLTTQSTVSQATNYVMTVAPSLIRNPEYQVSITRNPVAGSVVVDAANNRFLYNNSNNRVSSDSYQYRVTDGTREILQMEVSLDLTPIYIPPVSTTGAVTTASPSSSATATGSNIVTENNGISNIGIIAGVAGGGGALLLIILIVVVIVVMRRRKNNRGKLTHYTRHTSYPHATHMLIHISHLC